MKNHAIFNGAAKTFLTKHEARQLLGKKNKNEDMCPYMPEVGCKYLSSACPESCRLSDELKDELDLSF